MIPAIEQLDCRINPTTSVSLSNGVLTVQGDGGDNSIVVQATRTGLLTVEVLDEAPPVAFQLAAVHRVVVNGGAGFDMLVYSGWDDDVRADDARLLVVLNGNGDDDALMTLGGARVSLNGGGGNDDLDASGTDGDSTLSGGTGNDIVWGGYGNDVLFGNDGNDVLFGDEGDDSLTGGAGADTLMGNEGIDSVFGGTGRDVLYYDLDDTIVNGGSGSNTLILV